MLAFAFTVAMARELANSVQAGGQALPVERYQFSGEAKPEVFIEPNGEGYVPREIRQEALRRQDHAPAVDMAERTKAMHALEARYARHIENNVTQQGAANRGAAGTKKAD